MKANNKIRCGNLLLYPIDGASRIAFVPDKAIAHTNWICIKPLRAVQTNDVVLLLIIFGTWKFCENFINEDNFNNTFLLKNNSFATAVTWSYYKSNKGVLFNQVICKKNFLISVVGISTEDYE